jgi:hypothetical protein
MNTELHTLRAHKEDRDRIAAERSRNTNLAALLDAENNDAQADAYVRRIKELTAQLAAERDEVRIMTQQCVQLRQELAVEREEVRAFREMSKKGRDWNDELQATQQALVEALRNLCNEVPREQCYERWQEAAHGLATT